MFTILGRSEDPVESVLLRSSAERPPLRLTSELVWGIRVHANGTEYYFWLWILVVMRSARRSGENARSNAAALFGNET